MPFGRSLLQKKSLLRVSGEERSPEILISFHSGGSTSNQWRKLKNPWIPGRALFRPSCFGTRKKKRFFAQLAHSAGPTCISYLAEEASDRLPTVQHGLAAPPLAEAKRLKNALRKVPSVALSVQQYTSSEREGYRTYKSLPVLTEALSYQSIK
ncbi:hypothetical protein T459_22104 [Capsicum annuum]|uniref:Ribosomal protein L10 n=1 Tax=Capsicum annuum TaxID=4072 RepID=A0A2G2YYI4_CAPAN|nr:hypothetical protein T459_22104 [Capsicum annuum]